MTRQILRFYGGPGVGITSTDVQGSLGRYVDSTYPTGIPILDIKTRHMPHGIAVTRLSDEPFPDDLCAKLCLLDSSALGEAQRPERPYNTAMDAHFRGEDTATPYIELNVAGDLAGIETASIEAKRQGLRKRGIEYLVTKLFNLGSAGRDIINLHGGAAYDEKNNTMYLVVNPASGAGKTSLLLQLMAQGLTFITNYLGIKVSSDSLTFYPQQFGIKEKEREGRALVRLRQERYRNLLQTGVKFDGLGIIPHTAETSPAPVGGIFMFLDVPTHKEPIVIRKDSDTSLVLLRPFVTPNSEVSVGDIPTPYHAIEEAWRATWDLTDVFQSFNPSPESKAQVLSRLHAAEARLGPRVLPHLAGRVNRALDIAGPHNKILEAVRTYIKRHGADESE